MSNYFKQIIFPKKEKPVVLLTKSSEYKLFGTTWCGKNKQYISLKECIFCKIGDKSLKKILETGVGCYGKNYYNS